MDALYHIFIDIAIVDLLSQIQPFLSGWLLRIIYTHFAISLTLGYNGGPQQQGIEAVLLDNNDEKTQELLDKHPCAYEKLF